MRALVEEFLSIIGDLFSVVFDWIYSFIFVNLGSGFLDIGKTVYSSCNSLFYSSIASGNFLYIILGAIVGISIFKLVIKIVRG